MDHRNHSAQHSPELFLLLSIGFVALFLFGIGYALWMFARPVFTLPSLVFAEAFSVVLQNVIDDAALKSLGKFAETADPWTISWAQFYLLWSVLGGYFKWAVAAVALWAGYRGYRLHRDGIFKTTYSLESFIGFQSQAWSAIKAVSNHGPDILKAKAGQGWGSALHPDEWASRHKLLKDGAIDRGKTKYAFDKQLARPWLGAEKLPTSLRLLCASFLLLIAKEKTQAKSLLTLLSQMAEKSGNIDNALKDGSRNKDWDAYARAILNHPRWGLPVLHECALKHGFVETVFLSLLSQARLKSGVLPTAEFLWLKPGHRGLYYALNALGRKNFQVEAAGVMAHFEAECDKGQLLLIPETERAVQALADYVEAE